MTTWRNTATLAHGCTSKKDITVQPPSVQKHSLLFATFVALFLALTRDNLAQHDNTVTIHESNTRKTFAILECVANEWLLRLEAALRHLIRFQRVWVFHFLTTSLFAHLPLQLRDAACRTTAAHETNRRIPYFNLVWDIQDLDLGIELSCLTESGVLLVDHHITRTRHVVFVQTFDVQTNVVSWICEINAAAH